MASSKAEVVGAIVGVMGLVGVGFGLYGTYTADKATQSSKNVAYEKEHEVSSRKLSDIENELDVLWVDTQKNTENVNRIKEDQRKHEDAFIKFVAIAERLNLTVALLEERIRVKNGEPKPPNSD